jgi:glucokinase
VASESVLAVDIGGSGVRATCLPAQGPVVELPLERALGRDELLQRVVAAAEVAASVAGTRPEAGAVAIPSFAGVDGRVGVCPNLPALEGVDLAGVLAPLCATITVVPDVAAATLAEARRGSGRGVGRFLCVVLGTGVNAGATVQGRLVETAFGCLGDAGHVIVSEDGPECSCGGRGCLEAICSGYALARDGAELGLADARAVVAAAREGGEASVLVERAGRALGRAIATWSVLLAPDRVAAAGGLAAAGEALLGPARAELQRVGVPYLVGELELVQSELGRDATLLGAGEVALDLRSDAARSRRTTARGRSSGTR